MANFRVRALPLLALAASFCAHADAPPAGLREVSKRAVKYRQISGGEAVAQVQAALSGVTQSLSQGAQVAVFPYRPNKIYQVDIKPGMFTTFTLPKDEPVKQFAVSNPDAVEIHVNADANVAMLKLTAKVTLSATIVTDRHVYYLTISPAIDSWYQGVSWTYEDDATSGFGYVAKTGKTAQAPAARQDASPLEPDEYGLAGQPNFNYRYDGDAGIMPVSVWDNGRFTWIQFPDSVQSLPAVFFLGPDGPEVVNYVVQPGGKQIKVNRLMSRFMLRLGSSKVIVAAK